VGSQRGPGGELLEVRRAALVSITFGKAGDLQELVASGSIAGAGYEHLSPTAYRFVEVREFP
jgi:hypothetical protein